MTRDPNTAFPTERDAARPRVKRSGCFWVVLAAMLLFYFLGYLALMPGYLWQKKHVPQITRMVKEVIEARQSELLAAPSSVLNALLDQLGANNASECSIRPTWGPLPPDFPGRHQLGAEISYPRDPPRQTVRVALKYLADSEVYEVQGAFVVDGHTSPMKRATPAADAQ
jgi:hypothetical protein